ncbi:MAG: hypothetical protein JOZ98_00520 [Solirubrobacterales bacterium]|nr:hypothetical protein [Solirubrobacterales bacterium]MBV9800967.1 hypothetical protein [Solirubrobacterales bacterium]
MTIKQHLGLLGFLFVAAWIGFNFGDAVLCLVGAGIFYAVGSVLEGEVDLGEMQSRFQRSRSAPR